MRQMLATGFDRRYRVIGVCAMAVLPFPAKLIWWTPMTPCLAWASIRVAAVNFRLVISMAASRTFHDMMFLDHKVPSRVSNGQLQASDGHRAVAPTASNQVGQIRWMSDHH